MGDKILGTGLRSQDGLQISGGWLLFFGTLSFFELNSCLLTSMKNSKVPARASFLLNSSPLPVMLLNPDS
jgi:hypothetical protein